ncbi:protein RhiA, partial [Yersinia pestis PY-76]
MSFLWLCKPRP